MVEAHDPAVPLFTFWAPHIVHTPLQVPAAYYHKFNFIAPTDKVTHERQIYHAMVYGPLNYRTAARTLFLRPYLAHFCSFFRRFFADFSVLTP